MTDALAETAPSQPTKKPGYQFTRPGCRTELRLGALLVLSGTFLWLWLGPAWSTRLILVGLPLMGVGTVLQALASRKGAPGFPWQLGLAMTVLGAAMCWDLRYREMPGAAIRMMPVGPALLAGGTWLLLWWPVSRGKAVKDAEDQP